MNVFSVILLTLFCFKSIKKPILFKESAVPNCNKLPFVDKRFWSKPADNQYADNKIA